MILQVLHDNQSGFGMFCQPCGSHCQCLSHPTLLEVFHVGVCGRSDVLVGLRRGTPGFGGAMSRQVCVAMIGIEERHTFWTSRVYISSVILIVQYKEHDIPRSWQTMEPSPWNQAFAAKQARRTLLSRCQELDCGSVKRALSYSGCRGGIDAGKVNTGSGDDDVKM